MRVKVLGGVVAAAVCLFASTIPAAAVPQPEGPIPTEPAPADFPVPAPPDAKAPLPPPLLWLTAARTNGAAVTATGGAISQMVGGRRIADEAQRALDAARARLIRVDNDVADVEYDLRRLVGVREQVLAMQREEAVREYIDGGGATAIAAFSSASAADRGRSVVYAAAAMGSSEQTLGDVEHTRRRDQSRLKSLKKDQKKAFKAVDAASAALDQANAVLLAFTVAATDASHGGRVFPVDGQFEFDDSWGNFRATVAEDTGTHGHDATDIMAPLDTPVVAVETGVLDRVGWNALGGWRLWIKGISGTRYYYAHMSAYAPDLVEGMPVVAGQYLGRVGNTGNAQGGPTHLHFEVHLPTPGPGPNPDQKDDGTVVNPYPLLCLLTGAPIPVIPPSDPVAAPTTTSIVPGP